MVLLSDEENEFTEGERPRPRVVDKRVSARPPSAPDAETARTPPEPPPAEPTQTPPEPSTPPPSAPEDPLAGDAPEREAPRPEERVWTPEQEEQAQRLAQELAQRPSLDWIINTAVTLANVAGAKIELGTPEEARLAIDAFAALVNGLGSQLGDAERPLRQTLAELQMVYAQTVAAPQGQPSPRDSDG